ncbi:MAG: ion transporter [Lachnospiraceae bacterium]|nr:ion transporter [Lachnospiraceae bacterium]
MKKRIFTIIQIGNREDLPSRAFDFFIVINILCNIIAMFMKTFREFENFYPLLQGIEMVTTIVFCIEYVLRIYTAEYLYPEKSKTMAKIRFLYSYDGIVDLLTIIPFFFLSGFVALRLLRVVRIFHLFRINMQYDSFHVITMVLIEKKNQIISSIFIILVLMMASSLGMYSVEHEAQPEAFQNAFSGIWWSVSTILTVGYGDIYPITILGRIMAIVIGFLGVGVVAIPTGIISAGFVERYQKDQRQKDYHKFDKKDLVEIEVTKDLEGKTIDELVRLEGLKIYLVIRDDLSIIPMDQMILRLQDILVAKSEK